MLKKLYPYMKPYRLSLWIAVLCVSLETVFELIIPMMMADMIDVGVAARDLDYMIWKGMQMSVCAIISLILGLLYARFAAVAAQSFGADLRMAEFEQVQNYRFSSLDRFETSSLVTRLTNDVNVLQNAISQGLRPGVRAPMVLLTGLSVAFMMNGELALVFVVAIPILGAALFMIVRKVAPMYEKLQKAIDRVNLIVQENLTAIRVVKSYVREDFEQRKFAEVNEDLMKVSQRTFQFAQMNMPAFQFVMYGVIIMILWFGGNIIEVGGMQVGELTGFLSYVLQILNSLMMLSGVFLLLIRSIASAKRIEEVLDEPRDENSALCTHARIQSGSIDFEHVYFKYSEDALEYVLSDINLHIESGQTIGIMGGTGAAKSTLVQLIPRLYDTSKGTLKIDGRPIETYDLYELRDQISMVLQNNTLFSGTIRENLCWGNPHATQEELEWACRIACADEFIKQKPNGYDEDLGQGGVNVSGGQKQRLCIARALLKHPKVLIFDDSTSAVDSATESTIREGLASLKDVTKIIIAQRVTSVMNADQIIIMEDGTIADSGTHEELLARNATYQSLYHSQQEGVLEDGKTDFRR